jgi:hypothetical protein
MGTNDTRLGASLVSWYPAPSRCLLPENGYCPPAEQYYEPIWRSQPIVYATPSLASRRQ